VPFFVFKATEFELRNINGLYTDSSFYDFAEAYKDEETKIVVIDYLWAMKMSVPLESY
jgi:hypothetical protein